MILDLRETEMNYFLLLILLIKLCLLNEEMTSVCLRNLARYVTLVLNFKFEFIIKSKTLLFAKTIKDIVISRLL